MCYCYGTEHWQWKMLQQNKEQQVEHVQVWRIMTEITDNRTAAQQEQQENQLRERGWRQ